MAAIIGTATCVPALWGFDDYGVALNGFASGNLAGGIQPTQLSSDWCNEIQQEIVNATTQFLPFALGGVVGASGPADLAYALDNVHMNMRPIWSTNPAFTFRSQADSVLSANGQSCVYTSRTQNNFSLAPSSVTNIGILSVPSNTQCLASFAATVSQTDAISTNYAQVEYRVSLRNSAGVVTIQNSAVLYSHIPGIGYVFAISTSGANVTLRLTIPAVPAAKIHNAQAYSTLLNVTTGV